VYFFHDHRGKPIVSPALFEPIGEKFRRDIKDWAQTNGIPVIRFRAGERKADVMAPYLQPTVAAVAILQRPPPAAGSARAGLVPAGEVIASRHTPEYKTPQEWHDGQLPAGSRRSRRRKRPAIAAPRHDGGVRAENPVVIHGYEQQSCASRRPAAMITDHVSAVRLPPDHAGGLMAAGVAA
jgi:hypothetical protein